MLIYFLHFFLFQYFKFYFICIDIISVGVKRGALYSEGGSNPSGANLVLQFMEWLDLRVDHRTPNVAQCTMYMVYEGQRKIPNEIIVRQQKSSKIGTCQQVREF